MINKVEFEGFKYIGGGVCAAQGFKANGIQCGLAHKPLTDTEKNTANLTMLCLPPKRRMILP